MPAPISHKISWIQNNWRKKSNRQLANRDSSGKMVAKMACSVLGELSQTRRNSTKMDG